MPVLTRVLEFLSVLNPRIKASETTEYRQDYQLPRLCRNEGFASLPGKEPKLAEALPEHKGTQ